MSEHTKRGLAQDRAKVGGGQKHEMAYEAKKTGTDSGEVRAAVNKAGNWHSIAELLAKRAEAWAET